MAKIKPFETVRPQPQLAKLIASKPYDVLSSEEARKESNGNPYSYLHITKSEISLPKNVEIYSEEVYLKASENFKAFLQRDLLFVESKPCYYIYMLTMNKKTQTGLVCVSSLTDYENNIIKKHELTRPDKELDRINHIKYTGAQTGNVFLAYKNNNQIDELIENWKKIKSPIYNFITDDEIQHTIWTINEDAIIKKITEIFETKITETYIADGHHRAASAYKCWQDLGGNASPNAGYFLTTLFPANQLSILPYNRIVKNVHLSEPDLLLLLENDFYIEKKDAPYEPNQLHHFGMYMNSQWYELIAKENNYNNQLPDNLDVQILQNKVFKPCFNISDPRTSSNIEFIGGIRGLSELEKMVNEDPQKIAFSLFPVSIEQLFSIADNNQIMPPKSTWFEPKLRDGLFTHLI